jgi:hypothetical protein
MNDTKSTDIENKVRDFLAKDPIPELSDWEVQVLTQRVLARSKQREPLRIFGINPAWGITVVSVALLLIIALRIAPPELNPNSFDYQSYVEVSMPEVLLYEMISSGQIEEASVLSNFIDVDSDYAKELYYAYHDNEIDAEIEMLSDDEVEKVLEYLSEMPLFGDKEVL